MNEFEIIHYPQINGLNIFFNTVDHRTPHLHPELELIWVLDGCLAINCNRMSYQAQPDTLVLFNPNHPHEFHKINESCTFLCFQISTKVYEQSCPVLQHLYVDGLFPDEELSPASALALRQELKELARAYFEQGGCYELYCQARTGMILYRLMSELTTRWVSIEEAQEREKRNARLMRLFAFVDENYMHKIRLTDFAEAEKRSTSYLSHFIKETMNQTFQDYVNTVRFNAACKMIIAGGKKMLDVCFECGFSDYRYFSRTFRSRLGMTPEEYSRLQKPAVPQEIHIHRSLHSLEQFYSREKCLQLLDRIDIKRDKK